MYCKVEIVLQGEAGLYCSLRENCIARVALYCNREDWAGKILYCRLGGVVLQDCIARGLQENCIAIRKLYCDSRGLRQGLYCDTARCRATIRHAGRSRRAQGALGARGAPGRPGRQQGSLGARKRACVGRAGRHGAGHAAGGAGARHQRAAGAGARHDVGVQAGSTEHAGHGRLGGTDSRPVRTGWASWVLVHPAWFSTWFFDSVFFLSH